MYRLLSYPITSHMPAWPDSPQLELEKKLQIENGDVANTFMIHFYNHIGTHYDAPNHYVSGAKTISELHLNRFIYEAPLLLDIPKDSCEKVTPADLIPYEEQISRCDLLMIRTGFSKYRSKNPPIYEEQGPGISSECAEYLITNFKNISALAVDFVSLASFSDQEDGNKAHQILLGMYSDHFICGIEDVDMENVNSNNLMRVFAFPLFIKGIDSAPVTVIAQEK